MDKDDVVHIYNRILAIKKEQNGAICSNMDRNRDYHTKRVREKDKYQTISLITGI